MTRTEIPQLIDLARELLNLDFHLSSVQITESITKNGDVREMLEVTTGFSFVRPRYQISLFFATLHELSEDHPLKNILEGKVPIKIQTLNGRCKYIKRPRRRKSSLSSTTSHPS